jgi:ectoine hydroxylase-related dioxygenase (phytanoyl-CoA dioxygenase family)
MGDHPDEVTLNLSPGDAVVLDYRLLHGTHANDQDQWRDAILLTFAPSWRTLPSDVRAHLIQHPALPSEKEVTRVGWASALLPAYEGRRRSLRLNRHAPTGFALH